MESCIQVHTNIILSPKGEFLRTQPRGPILFECSLLLLLIVQNFSTPKTCHGYYDGGRIFFGVFFLAYFFFRGAREARDQLTFGVSRQPYTAGRGAAGYQVVIFNHYCKLFLTYFKMAYSSPVFLVLFKYLEICTFLTNI